MFRAPYVFLFLGPIVAIYFKFFSCSSFFLGEDSIVFTAATAVLPLPLFSGSGDDSAFDLAFRKKMKTPKEHSALKRKSVCWEVFPNVTMPMTT